jgi:hypothetical protein
MLKAGASQVVITPPVGTALRGYFRKRISDGILDELHAKTLVLDDGERQAALVICDLIGVSRDAVKAARELISERCRIPGDSVMIAGTHTHTGPSLEDSGFSPVDPDWCALFPRLIAGGVTAALGGLKPAELAVYVGHEDSIAFNRRYRMKDGTVKTNPGVGNPEVVEPAGPIDPDVGVLCLREEGGGELIAVLVNYACHLDVIGGTKISADYPGYLARFLRNAVEGDFVVLFGTGTCGDINHIDVFGRRSLKGPEHARRMGMILAGEALKALGRMRGFRADLSVKAVREDVELPYRKVTEEEVTAARRILEDPQTPGPSTFRPDWLQARKIVTLSEMTEESRRTEIQAIAIGDTAILGLPGEVFVEIGLRIKRGSPASHTFILEQANDSLGYLPTKRALGEGGYEPSSSLYADDIEEILVGRSLDVLRKVVA